MSDAICFVAMPFRKKKDADGREINFDSIYENVIEPAIIAAGLEPLRADKDPTRGIIHKPMLQALVLCDYAVVDLTTANANVLYELGVRHAQKPYTTVLMFREGSTPVFDVAPLRALPYPITKKGIAETPEKTRDALTQLLLQAREAPKQTAKLEPDSPLFQLISNYPNLEHDRAEVFRNASAIGKMRNDLARARGKGRDALYEFEQTLGDITEVDASVLLDLMISYRDHAAFQDVVNLVEKMSKPLAATHVVREQHALALNRLGRGDEAEEALKEVIAERGKNPETCGLLGRIYKDRWAAAKAKGDELVAKAELRKAIQTYLDGFEADWRDHYPGVNAVTLMDVAGDPRRDELVPIVMYAVRRKIAASDPDYWDWATLLELAVIGGDEKTAQEALGEALSLQPPPMQRETTRRNLNVLAQTRAARGTPLPWLDGVIGALE